MEFDLITLRIHVYRHGSSSLNGSLFWCRKKDEGQPLDSYEPLRQGERRRRCDLQESIAPHRAAGKKTYQRILMVFLVNSRHNESAVPPPEFLLSTPTLNIKISRISSLFSFLHSVAFFQPSVKIPETLCPLFSLPSQSPVTCLS